MSEDRATYTTEPDDTDALQQIMAADQAHAQATSDTACVAAYMTGLIDRGIRRKDALFLTAQWQQLRAEMGMMLEVGE